MNIRNGVLVAFLSLGLGFGITACGKKDEGPMDKTAEQVKDGLDMREHEKIKDAGEDVKDAAEDTAEEVKEEAKDATN
ncbi:MAG TPA: hypothetical protein VJM11_11450 [Nevskiaceae bacterium]|nr:hypothetical protein [Nevskiaceae bacterium]